MTMRCAQLIRIIGRAEWWDDGRFLHPTIIRPCCRDDSVRERGSAPHLRWCVGATSASCGLGPVCLLAYISIVRYILKYTSIYTPTYQFFFFSYIEFLCLLHNVPCHVLNSINYNLFVVMLTGYFWVHRTPPTLNVLEICYIIHQYGVVITFHLDDWL